MKIPCNENWHPQLRLRLILSISQRNLVLHRYQTSSSYILKTSSLSAFALGFELFMLCCTTCRAWHCFFKAVSQPTSCIPRTHGETYCSDPAKHKHAQLGTTSKMEPSLQGIHDSAGLLLVLLLFRRWLHHWAKTQLAQ